jgi:hypothetical protein
MRMMKYLDEYVKFCGTFYSGSFVVTLNLDREVVFVGDKYLDVIKKTREEVIGKPLYETTPIPEQNRVLSRIAFSDAISNKQTKQVFIANLYHPYPESHILMLLFSPILAPTTEVIAMRLDFTPVDIAYFFQVLIRLNQKITPQDLPKNDDLLTIREHQVAFLLCHCKDVTEISQVVSLFSEKEVSSKTIHNIINRYLFTKFNVTSKSKLIDILRETGYDKKMPSSLLSNQFIDLTKSEFSMETA